MMFSLFFFFKTITQQNKGRYVKRNKPPIPQENPHLLPWKLLVALRCLFVPSMKC